MADRAMLSDQKIQDYIDDRLDDRERAVVAAYLLANPDAASQVEMLRRQNEALQGIGQEILDEPVPPHLLEVVRRHTDQPAEVSRPGRRRLRFSGFLEAAAAILLFCVGGALGWFLHDVLTPRPGVEDLMASNAADMYMFYGGDHNYPVDFPPDQTDELVSWINRSFNREISPPDLANLSYEYRGGQLLPSSGARIGFFQFEGPEGASLAVVFWPGGSAAHPRADRPAGECGGTLLARRRVQLRRDERREQSRPGNRRQGGFRVLRRGAGRALARGARRRITRGFGRRGRARSAASRRPAAPGRTDRGRAGPCCGSGC